MASDIWVKKNANGEIKAVECPSPDDVELAPGQVLLTVDHFALTANNVTYAVAGDMLNYWQFFPTGEDEWGRIPVWGFGTVAKSACEGVENGQRFYGYYPMSSYVVVEPHKISPAGFLDGAAHRAGLNDIYNSYSLTAKDPSYNARTEDLQMLYRPLFTTSFLIDDFLTDNEFFGAKAVIISSASSKTAFGVAFLSGPRKETETIGLTSKGNVGFVEDLGVYDRVIAYEDIETLDAGIPAAFVDIAGNATVRAALHHHFGSNMKYSCSVGLSHWDQMGATEDLPGAEPTMFFAPSQAQKRIGEWGADRFQRETGDAWRRFITKAEAWLVIHHGDGPEAVTEVYKAMVEGTVAPSEGHILKL